MILKNKIYKEISFYMPLACYIKSQVYMLIQTVWTTVLPSFFPPLQRHTNSLFITKSVILHSWVEESPSRTSKWWIWTAQDKEKYSSAKQMKDHSYIRIHPGHLQDYAICTKKPTNTIFVLRCWEQHLVLQLS